MSVARMCYVPSHRGLAKTKTSKMVRAEPGLRSLLKQSHQWLPYFPGVSYKKVASWRYLVF